MEYFYFNNKSDFMYMQLASFKYIINTPPLSLSLFFFTTQLDKVVAGPHAPQQRPPEQHAPAYAPPSPLHVSPTAGYCSQRYSHFVRSTHLRVWAAPPSN